LPFCLPIFIGVDLPQLCRIQNQKFEEKEAEARLQDKERQGLLAERLALSALPALWLELEHIEPVGSHDTGENHVGNVAISTAVPRLSINEKEMHLGGLSCCARLPLQVFQLADLASVTKLTFTEIWGLVVLELAMFMLLEGLEFVTASACPTLKAVILTSTDEGDNAGRRWKLQQLDFSMNPVLSSLPLQAITAITSVRELACAGCPNLWSPPQEVAAQGGEACMDFARAIKNGAVDKSTQMTLFLLGDGEAGKTSVLRALMSASDAAERIREDTRTVGIDTEEWRPEAALGAGGDSGEGSAALWFRVLDLAGQAVYEQTHQFFLLQRAVYLLVWRAFPLADDRRGVLTDRVRHWMDSLQLRVPGACVMLVATHIDSVDAAAVDALCSVVRETVRECLAAMRRDAPIGGRVLRVFHDGESQRINCLLGEGVAALREQLLGFARTMPWYGELLPASFGSVRGAVEQLTREGRRHMPVAEWVQLCRDHSMDGQMLAVGTRFLHETGSVRFFGDAEALTMAGGGDGTVYLSAEFMVSVMKGLVRHDRQALQDYFVTAKDRLMLRRTNRLNATGRLHESLVPFLWPTAEASGAYWDWVRRQGQREAELWPKDIMEDKGDLERALGLLEGFDLVVRIKGDDELLVPGALPPARTQLSSDAFASDDELPFAASRTYPALPAGAFQRIVVRVAGRANWSDFSTERAVFYLLGNVATLAWFQTVSPAPGAAEKRTVLKWRASGKQLRAIIADEVDTIERFFPGLPCLDHEETSTSLSWELAQLHAMMTGYVDMTKSSFPGLNRLDPQSPPPPPPPAREPTQVLVLAASDEAAALVVEAVETAAQAEGIEGLVVKAHGPKAQHLTAADLERVRVLVACMSPELSASKELVGRVKALLSRRVPATSVLLAGFDSQWGALQQPLALSPVDLRTCTATRAHTEAEVRKQLEAEERDRLAREGRPRKRTPKRNMTRRLHRETEEKLKKQALDAAEAVRIELLPWVKQLLGAWRAQPSAASVLSSGPSTGAAAVTLEVRQCPACARKGAAVCGYFGARECRLRMGERLEQRSYTAQCRVCGEEVSLFDVFPPEVYCSIHTPPGGLSVPVIDLIRAIEAEADVLIWPARDERGGGPDSESRRALALAQVVLLLVTEEYAASSERAAEAREAGRTGKLVVPVLLPGLARDAAQAIPSPLEAEQQRPEVVEAFWRGLVAHRRDALRRRDALDWILLGDNIPLLVPAEASEPGAESPLGCDVACQVVARIASRLHRAVKVAVFSDLSRFGVRLAYLATFIEGCGGRAALAGLTTFDVMQLFVKPRTETSQLSLCEQLLSEGGDDAAFVATARVFLSHAWKYLFLDVVDAVDRRFQVGGGARSEDPVLWFDVFSVSQHKSDERDFTWWNSTFLNAVGSMGEVVMVMQPWHAPVTLARVWCIFEAYAAEATRSRFSIAMTAKEASELVRAICKDPSSLLATLRRVCCEASIATQLGDRDRIFDTVRQSVGFSQLDGMVAARMLEAMCAELRAQADAAQAMDSEDRARLLEALAQLHALQRKPDEAERLHRECLRIAAGPSLVQDTSLRLRASLGIATACARQGKRGEALEAYSSVLRATAALPRGHPVRLEAASGLALECYAEQLIEADCLAEEWEADCARAQCGVALRNLGQLRLAQGRLMDAERLLRAGVDALRGWAGECSPLLPWHPDTLEALACVAVVLEMQGRTAEAEDGLRWILSLSERFIGVEHADTRAIRGRLAALVGSGRRDAAGAGTGIGSGAGGGLVQGGSQPFPPVNDSVQTATAGSSSTVNSIPTTWEMLEELWQELPSLLALQELQLRRVQGLDRGTCLHLAMMALSHPAACLRRVDLR
jgi:hypothetical protein